MLLSRASGSRDVYITESSGSASREEPYRYQLCADTGSDEDVGLSMENPADDVEDRLLQAKARNAAWLHNVIAMSPCAFVIRYIDPPFIGIYLQLRPRYTMVKLFVYAVILLSCFPWVYSMFTLPYPCDDIVVVTNVTGQLHSLRLHQQDCKVQDFMRSPWMLLLGPLYLACGMAATWVFRRGDECAGRLARLLLRLRPWLPGVPYNGLGPRLTWRGTGGLCIENLVKDERHKQQVNLWLHDYCGSEDVFFLTTMMNVAMCVSCLVTPALVAFHVGAKMMQGVGMGAALVLIFGRATFSLSNFIFGASGDLIHAVHQKMHKWESKAKLQQWATAFPDAQEFLEGLAKCHADNLGLQKLVALAKDQPAMEYPVLPGHDVRFHNASVFDILYSCNGPTLALHKEDLDALALVNPKGVAINFLDPSYEVLMSVNFRGTMVVYNIILTDEGTYAEEANGQWKVVRSHPTR